MDGFFTALTEHAFLQTAVAAALLASIGCGVMGTYVVVKRIAFIAGGIAHSVLGGMGAAVYYGVDPLHGALPAAIAAALLIGWVRLHWRAQEDTLIGALWPAETTKPLRWIALAVLGTALLTLSAKINIPFYPVPLTMQTFVVLAIGMAYGPRLGVATLLLYLAEGAVGLPVFAGTPEKGIGVAYMMGTTGGYLLKTKCSPPRAC